MNRGGRRGAPKAVSVEQLDEVAQELGDEELQEVREFDVETECTEPTIADLTGLLRAHMAKMEAQEAQRIAELAQQERRFKALHHQFGLLQLEVQARTTTVPNTLVTSHDDLDHPDEGAGPSRPLSQSSTCRREGAEARDTGQCPLKEPKLEKLSDGDDVEHFLITFERMAAVCRWPKEEWVFHLIPLLTGKARAAYVHMDVDESLNYDELKSAVLRKYDISRETYRQRFRSLEVEHLESPKELYVRLKELYGKWMQPKSKSIEEIGEVIILEQYLRMLSPELQVWVREHDPQSASQAATLADVFVAARQRNQSWWWKSSRDDRRANPPQPSMRNFPGAGKPPGGGPAFVNAPKNYRKMPICYLCNQEGHTKPMCPRNVIKNTHLCYVPRHLAKPAPKAERSPASTTVEINGKEMIALVDTGSDQTLVHMKCISPALLRYTNLKAVRCVHGDEKLLPTAEVYLKVRGQTYFLEVGVADNLPFPVVLGHDLPVLWDLLQPPSTCNMVVTRAQSHKRDESKELLATLPFFDAEIDGSTKPRKSRRQKRFEKIQYNASVMPVDKFAEFSPKFKLPVNIMQMQQEDASLVPYLERAKQEDGKTVDGETKERFCMYQGLLYRQMGQVTQLVVPQCVREVILTLGHSIPWAGHLGKRKTIARIRKHFYWPGLNSEVAQYCKTCPECQKVSSDCPRRVPLQPLPLIGTPFERLGMDIVGPVEKSRSGNRFMLVVTDYATRYPEVFPLRSVKAKYVATCLVQLFSRVGFPSEILTDQGTNFMSNLLKQVYRLLGIKSLRTTPYHPQTDGLTERFNQTLKQMLRKFVGESGTDWDQWLPYLLFAYREVPQASTGFSPFELLYGHEVKGPLALLREVWEGNPQRNDETNVASYVIQMRERLQKMSALAQSHLAEAQTRQKTWYDQSARERQFKPGQKVLVMLPSHESKLLAKWQGPYEIKRKLGPTTYEVALSDHAHSTRTLHINLLKEWFPRPPESSHSLMIRQVKEEDDSEVFLPQSALGDVDLSHLSPQQQHEVREICLPEVFSEYPGFTTLIEHNIELKPDAVVRRMSYRVPERLQEALKEEVDLMLRLGIIEPSKSEWCHPVVLVPKKDGSIRFCIDFRYLNSVTKFDAYPTPRISDLTDRLGTSKFLTTIDLSKGYWQIPLTPQSRELTAFKTPWGLFHFKVLAFGLHGAPASFQRLMDQVLRGLPFTAAYLDDIVVYSDTWQQHLQHLQEVLQRLQAAGLTVNPQKCTIAKAETEYLGFVIGKGVLRPQVEKVRAIEECPQPQTRKELRSFLGMAGFYHRFIPNFSGRAAVLTDMVGSRSPNQLKWTQETVAAFQDLRKALSKDSVLHNPDFHQPFVLQTDASDRGLGAVLLQGSPDTRRPVAFLSRKLFPREVRYSIVEKECLAVKWALDSLKYYLLGREFILETDHKALQWLQEMKDTNSRITRWYLAMQPFRFIIRHVPGKENLTADYLSRCASDIPEGRECVVATH
ncbi:uncharacterized protein [Danio rerio]|uniref:Gypsy retrotransposon integrase-like protein 1 n=1 Tax=Danio rerio TaxID=7955 RepID=A0AB32TCG1_DANRE